MIYRLESVGSTMVEAAELASAGAPHGTVVVAEEQTAGIGRHGHSWHSERGSGLYLSLVLRTSLPAAHQPLLTLALGLAVWEAIRSVSAVVCDLRWPNDLLASEAGVPKKVSGILVQMIGQAAIAGIGVNVNHSAFPPSLAAEATSLRIVTGRRQDCEELLAALLPAVESSLGMLEREGKEAVFRLFSERSSYASGKPVRVEGGDRIVEGVTAGLDEGGFLMVRQQNGSMIRVVGGGVRPA